MTAEERSRRLLVEAIDNEPDPRRRANLEVVARHVRYEIDGDIDSLLTTMVAEPSYRIWGASTTPGPRGHAEVRAFYERLVSIGKNRLEFFVTRVIVDDRHVVTEGEMRHASSGAELTGRSTEAGEPVDADGWYLVAYQALIVWPVAESGLLEGEDIYAGEPARVLRRLAPGEMAHLGPDARRAAEAPAAATTQV